MEVAGSLVMSAGLMFVAAIAAFELSLMPIAGARHRFVGGAGRSSGCCYYTPLSTR